MTELVPPSRAAFTSAFFSKLKFQTGDQGMTYLKVLARQNRFFLSPRDSTKADVIRRYCHREARGKGNKTAKTNCEFRAKLSHLTDGFVIMPKSVLEHKHDLLPLDTESLPDNVHSHAKI
jgi:hypothetical protein